MIVKLPFNTKWQLIEIGINCNYGLKLGDLHTLYCSRKLFNNGSPAFLAMPFQNWWTPIDGPISQVIPLIEVTWIWCRGVRRPGSVEKAGGCQELVCLCVLHSAWWDSLHPPVDTVRRPPDLVHTLSCIDMKLIIHWILEEKGSNNPTSVPREHSLGERVFHDGVLSLWSWPNVKNSLNFERQWKSEYEQSSWLHGVPQTTTWRS